MKTVTNIIGILLIIFGIATFGYQNLQYSQTKQVAKIGNVEITADTNKTITIPPVVSGLSLLAGIALVIIARIK